MKTVISNNKKGGSAVFLMMIIGTLMSITIALIYGVKEEAVRSSADAIISMAGDSVMSEYDRTLQDEYGLFLIKGRDEELSQKLQRYISYSFSDMENVVLQSVQVSAGRFSITDTGEIRRQILEYMKVKEAAKLLKNRDEEKETIPLAENRTLRHGPTITSLPSAEVPHKGLTASAEALADKASDVERAFKAGSEEYLINRYVFEHFNSRTSMVDKRHFFSKEVEYILGGEKSDAKNEKRIEIALKAMRFLINMAYLSTDAEKQAALATVAQTMTPGPAAVATQVALMSTWAYAEADNDVELLWDGYKVPMVKDKSTWAIDLDSAIEGVFGGTVIPAKEKGYGYNEYLQILLFFQDSNIKTARILDLIQINMRNAYDGEFLINEYSTGIWIKVKVNGRNHEYEKKY